MSAKRQKNKYCALASLRNESDVEQFFVLPLLQDLGYGPQNLETKATSAPRSIGKGRRRRMYIPDYIGYADSSKARPVLVVDAKHPDQSATEGVDDAQMYASVLRRYLRKPKPDQFCVGSNALLTVVKHYDSDDVLHELEFSDFADANVKFEALKQTIGREARIAAEAALEEPFEFTKPDIPSLIAIFEACHNLIWRKEKVPPAEAFYEFAKLLFVKLRKDGEIHRRLLTGPVTPADFEFSVRWIETLESATVNPINAILFARLRDDLEDEIHAGTKKRMFDPGENIKLTPATVKEVVRLLEHRDLYTIDEDLNGRMFETFLTAVIRGRSLGQFFTPRTVVKFMVDAANITINAADVPRIIDACCGTGGFLIEALARLTDGVQNMSHRSGAERSSLMNQVLRESLWGIEANETVARVARINMYLHQDGGSRIYHTDALDKDTTPDHELVGEAKRDLEELRKGLIDGQAAFDVALTNPPFAMRYEARKKDEKRILRQYEMANLGSKLSPSLKSSVMFLERYYDLLKPGGALLTIIDDSVLNTSTFKPVRDWMRSRFTIRAIVSLPKNCFVTAGSAAKTSVLVLEKKRSDADSQPAVFLARSLSVGHTDSGKPDLGSSDLPAVHAEWNRFRTTGTAPTKERCFVVASNDLHDRLDVQWYDPEYLQLYEKLRSVPHWRLEDLKPTLKYGASIDADYKSDIPFLRIENLRRNDIDLSDLQFIPSAVHAKQARSLFLREGDILIARSGTYVGLCAHVGVGLESFVYGSYIIRLRLPDAEEIRPRFLAIYLNSRFGQMQYDRVKTGSLQFNINMEQIRGIIIPKVSLDEQDRIIGAFDGAHAAIKSGRAAVKTQEAELAETLATKITTAAGIRGTITLRDFLA